MNTNHTKQKAHLPDSSPFTARNPLKSRHKFAVTLAVLAAAFATFALSATAQTVGYIADQNGTFGSAGNNGGLDIGHTFIVSGNGIRVLSLGVFDYQGNGLNSSHAVALFSGTGSGSTLVPGSTVTVPSGTSAALKDGFRFWPLSSPITLPAGNYSVIVYQMNGGSGSDGYGQGTTGFIGDANVSDTGTTYNFETASPPTYPYQNPGSENLASCSFTYVPLPGPSDYAPIALTPGSYNADAIVEQTAPPAPASITTVTMDNGTGNTGTTWYEIGANSSAPSTGIPLHGSTFASLSFPDHSYTMAPDYHSNNVFLIDGTVTSGAIAVSAPAAYSSLSFLITSGNGGTTFGYSIYHADSSVETGTFSSGDWFNGSTPAVIAGGRVGVPNSFGTTGENPRLYTADVTLTNTVSAVTNIVVTHSSGSGHGMIFAVSGSKGSGFSPIAITGYDKDAVVEATGALNGQYTTVSMDGGTGNNGNSWYELGYDRAAVNTGIPNAGSTVSSAGASDHFFTFAPSYSANDVAYVDSSHGAHVAFATPQFYSALSFLTSAGHGPISVNYSVNHADGTSETGTFSSPDWFNNSPPIAWVANGRADVDSGGLNNVNNNDPAIYSADISLSNPTSQILSVDLSTSTGGGQAMVFAVSGVVDVVPPTAPYNIAIAPTTLTGYLGGAASFSISASGTLPFTYQWYQGALKIIGATNATLTLSSLTSGDATSYSCAVGNSAGTNRSGNAELTISPLPQGVAGVVLSDEPVAYYRLNEAGPLVADTAINYGSLGATDNATNFPGATHQVAGAIIGDPDTAMGYGGIDTNSDDGAYPTIIPFDAALNPNGSFTVEAWLQPNLQGNLGNAQAPLNNDYVDQFGVHYGWDFFQRAAATQTPDANGPGYSFRMWNGGGSSTESDNLLFNITGGQYTVGAWSHLVAVYDATVPSATLYFNGVQVAQSTAPNGIYFPNWAGPMSIGGYPDGTENPFFGQIDEFAFYGTALTAQQVMNHYQNGTNAARSMPYPTIVTNDGALEYLRLDEPVVNVARNSGSLGYLANGIFVNTGTPVSGPDAPFLPGFEPTNLAVEMNGSNDYVELLNPPGMNTTGPITLEAWVQPAATQGSEAYILAHGYNDSGSGEVVLRIENGAYQIASIFGRAVYTVPAEDLGSGEWVHLAGTYDGAHWNLYRNGVLVATGADGIGPTQVNNANWAIGARGRWKYGSGYPINGLDRQFNGAIDEVALYNYALPASRIEAHYAESVKSLTISPSGNQITLTWTFGKLQQANAATGQFSDVPNATSPYTTSANAPQKFYRLRY
jgi:hypothetical protein